MFIKILFNINQEHQNLDSLYMNVQHQPRTSIWKIKKIKTKNPKLGKPIKSKLGKLVDAYLKLRALNLENPLNQNLETPLNQNLETPLNQNQNSDSWVWRKQIEGLTEYLDEPNHGWRRIKSEGETEKRIKSEMVVTTCSLPASSFSGVVLFRRRPLRRWPLRHPKPVLTPPSLTPPASSSPPFASPMRISKLVVVVIHTKINDEDGGGDVGGGGWSDFRV